MGLRLRDPMDADEIVHVRFWIPECATSIQARGEIAWSDLEGNAGLRFTAMAFAAWPLILTGCSASPPPPPPRLPVSPCCPSKVVCSTQHREQLPLSSFFDA